MRAISDAERALLSALLEIDFGGSAGLRAQAEHIVGVDSNCKCGCPSITPLVDRDSAAPVTLASTLFPVELQEIDRDGGIPRTVLLFIDSDGYLANLECVYYDEPRGAWPDPSRCAVLRRDRDGDVLQMTLPSGAVVRPHAVNDVWVSVELSTDGVAATTFSCYRETFDSRGTLIDRVFTK